MITAYLNQHRKTLHDLMHKTKQKRQKKEGKEIWWRGEGYEGEEPHTWIGDIPNTQNAHLIANAPTWIRELLEENEKQRIALEKNTNNDKNQLPRNSIGT